MLDSVKSRPKIRPAPSPPRHGKDVGTISVILERAAAFAMSALARYLAWPLGEFSTLTSTDRLALAAVLRPGDVLLSSGSSRCAALVKRLTRSTWSHVSMYVGPLQDERDPLCVVEAHIADGVRAIRLSDLDARRICVLRPMGLGDADRGRLVASVLRHLGSEYDRAQAWMVARRLLVHRWRAQLQSLPTTMVRTGTRFICATLIGHAFALIGHSIVPAGETVSDPLASCNSLVPADFEVASVFAIVWPLDMRDERI